MPGPLATTPLGVQDSLGFRAIAKISPNTRALASTGFASTVFDTYLFPVPLTPNIIGQWVVPNTRVLVNGVPTVGQSSVGLTYAPSPTGLTPTGPMLPVQGDPRTQGA